MNQDTRFNEIPRMATEAERRKIAAQVMASMAPHWLCYPGEKSLVSEDDLYKTLADMAVKATDALIAELDKNKDNRVTETKTGWIARDGDGGLHFYRKKPIRDTEDEDFVEQEGDAFCLWDEIFPALTYTDEPKRCTIKIEIEQ